MRWVYVALVGMVVVFGALVLSRRTDDTTDSATTRPVPTPVTLTQETILLGESEMPGCTGSQISATLSNAKSRTFQCSNGDVLKSVLALYKDGTEARDAIDKQWGTLDTAREQIKTAIVNRPVNPESLRVVDAAATYPKLGADQETIYCATFTDISGTVTVVEYFGTFRSGIGVVTYTAFTDSGGTCDTPPARSLTAAQTIGKAQLQKIKRAAAAGR